jgi:MFS transporter, putative metabolite:H+ symporter
MSQAQTHSRRVALAILVAALGYFVDIYDLILFSIVRVPSLKGIGVPNNELLNTGVMLLNMQMTGMLVGGVLWGIIGDKKGRLSVLFGSILMYSIANIANGLVTSVPAYAALRLFAGIGLAGELGAGVTLVSEIMSKESRGYGTMLVAGIGIFGAVVGALVGDLFDWRIAYYVGGAMGVCLLAMRIGVYESGAFVEVARTTVRRGNFLGLFTNPRHLRKYASVILIGLPCWYVVAILVTFAPEFGQAMGMTVGPAAGRAVMFCYIGIALGGFLSGTLSQVFRTRKKVVRVSVLGVAAFVAVFFVVAKASPGAYYSMCTLMGLACGYWAVFVTMAAEQFGTNIRATVATTAPNFVRGAVVPMTWAFQIGRGYLGTQGSGIAVGVVAIVVALVALSNLDETYGKDLNYVDH